jgi:hypothetical protein
MRVAIAWRGREAGRGLRGWGSGAARLEPTPVAPRASALNHEAALSRNRCAISVDPGHGTALTIAVLKPTPARGLALESRASDNGEGWGEGLVVCVCVVVVGGGVSRAPAQPSAHTLGLRGRCPCLRTDHYYPCGACRPPLGPNNGFGRVMAATAGRLGSAAVWRLDPRRPDPKQPKLQPGLHMARASGKAPCLRFTLDLQPKARAISPGAS